MLIYLIDAEEAVVEVTLQQPFDIKSAYNNPKYTNFTVGFAACLDYIFYQTNNLRVLQVTCLRLLNLVTLISIYSFMTILTGCSITK